HHLRCAALSVLPLVRMRGDLFETVCGYTADSHPKVRQTALAAILRQHTMGVELPVDTYDDCVAATKDDFEQVRLVAVELLWAISSTFPEYPVVIRKHRGGETIRLLDDAFVKICDMVNDGSVVVRQRACTVLGRFKQVDATFLCQTFSKQVMSHLRRYVPRSGGGRGGYAGRNRGVKGKTAIPTPHGDTDVEADEFRLLDSGAAGAFVHGLEDEHQEVRDATIESIAELCAASADFAAKAVDFLVDMFNDSSDRVRIRAMRALTRIGAAQHIQLTEEQLSIAMSAMKDADYAVRHAIYAFLGVCVLAKAKWLDRLAGGFKANLEKYPADQLPIYASLSALGQHHAITVAFARSLLGISDHYLSREARIDDVVYAGNVILIMNAKPESRKAIAEALPDYICTHLPYLNDKYPGCLPPDIAHAVPCKLAFVKLMLDRPHPDPSVSKLTLDDSRRKISDVFGAIVATLEDVVSGDRMDSDGTGAAASLAARVSEFNALSTDPEKAAPDERQQAVARYAQLVSHVLDVQQEQQKQPRVLKLASLIMHRAYELDARTVGLGSGCKLALAAVRLFAHAAWLNAHALGRYDRRLADKMVGELVRRMGQTVQLQGASIHCGGIRASMQRLEQKWSSNDDAMCQEFGDELAAFVRQFTPLPFGPTGLCRRASAHLHARPTAMGQPIEYNHAFPLRLPLAASLRWVARRSAVAVAVTLPTQQTLYLAPPLSTIKPQMPMHWAMHWDDVPLSLPLSSGEATAVRLSVVLLCQAQMPWTDALVVKGAAVPAKYSAERYFRAVGDPQLQHIAVDIADESHSVSVNPVEFRAPASIHTRI
ncbi:hypothetical protein LPJ59_002071, partial [Coemansia sp. RSA 2399]